jgi:hypothetical protein
VKGPTFRALFLVTVQRVGVAEHAPTIAARQLGGGHVDVDEMFLDDGSLTLQRSLADGTLAFVHPDVLTHKHKITK